MNQIEERGHVGRIFSRIEKRSSIVTNFVRHPFFIKFYAALRRFKAVTKLTVRKRNDQKWSYRRPKFNLFVSI